MVFRTVISVYIVFVLLSCEAKTEYKSIPFTEPQPANIKNEVSTPSSIRGVYFSLRDSTRLDITEKTISTTYNIYKDSITIKGDIIEVFYKESTDTILDLNRPTFLLRKFKGFYFLNEKSADGWNVIRLFYKKNYLSFSTISPEDSLAPVAEITQLQEIKDDSGNVVTFSANPTRKELKQLMKKGLFLDREIWVKIGE